MAIHVGSNSGFKSMERNEQMRLGVYVDDKVDDLNSISSMLSVSGDAGIRFSAFPVKELAELAAEILEVSPSIVALDFRLDEDGQLSPRHAFKGGGLAQQLRDRLITEPLKDFPIVLVSAESKFNSVYKPDTTAHDLFDRTYVKESLSDPVKLDSIHKELVALCRAYETLRDLWPSGEKLSVFGLPSGELKVVTEIQELRECVQGSASPHALIRYFLRNIVDRPGLLFSDADVCARLGIQQDAFEDIRPHLVEQGLRYEGILCEGWSRWWAHKLESWAEEVFGQRLGLLTGAKRVEILNTKLGLKLATAKSRWNQSTEERFAFVCASCGHSTEVRHSLSAFDPFSPRYAAKQRICWDCIQTDQYSAEGLRVDDTDMPLVEKIKSIKDRLADN